MPIAPMPYFRYFTPGSTVIPKLYWESYSQEQRIHALCREYAKLVAYDDELAGKLNSTIDVVNKMSNDLPELVNEDVLAEIQRLVTTGEFGEMVAAAIQELADDYTELETKVDGIALDYVKGYDTVADMIADDTVIAGMIVRTCGFYSADDGGAAFYIIKTGTPNNMDKIALRGNLIAELVMGAEIAPECMGAHADGVTDDSAVFARIVEFGNKVIKMTDGKSYGVAEQIVLKNGTTTKGAGYFKALAQMDSVVMVKTADNVVYDLPGTTKYKQFDLNVDCNNMDLTDAIRTANIYACDFNICIRNCKKIGLHTKLYELRQGFYAENKYNRVTFENPDTSNYEDSVAVYARGNDDFFGVVTSSNAKIGVRQYGGGNVFDHVHCWVSSANCYPESIAFQSEGWSGFILGTLYDDGCNYGYVQKTSSTGNSIGEFISYFDTAGLTSQQMALFPPKYFDLANQEGSGRAFVNIEKFTPDTSNRSITTSDYFPTFSSSAMFNIEYTDYLEITGDLGKFPGGDYTCINAAGCSNLPADYQVGEYFRIHVECYNNYKEYDLYTENRIYHGFLLYGSQVIQWKRIDTTLKNASGNIAGTAMNWYQVGGTVTVSGYISGSGQSAGTTLFTLPRKPNSSMVLARLAQNLSVHELYTLNVDENGVVKTGQALPNNSTIIINFTYQTTEAYA